MRNLRCQIEAPASRQTHRQQRQVLAADRPQALSLAIDQPSCPSLALFLLVTLVNLRELQIMQTPKALGLCLGLCCSCHFNTTEVVLLIHFNNLKYLKANHHA